MSTPENPALDDIAGMYDKRRKAAAELSRIDAMIGRTVREAREGGATWAQIAKEAKTSDVAVLKAARRLDPAKVKKAG